MNRTNSMSLITPSSVPTMLDAQTSLRDVSTPLFGNKHTHRDEPTIVHQQQDETTEPDSDIAPTMDSDLESYQTPRRRLVNDFALYLDPPPLPKRKFTYCDGENRTNRDRTSTSISIPLIGLKRSSFQLLPRNDRTCNSPPRRRPKLTLRDIYNFSLRQSRSTSESQVERRTFQSKIVCCKDKALFENLQVNSKALECEKIRRSFNSMRV
mmetsp:Transcript_35760/g.42721  ORF Transcript_35760/g.42721 Transcript_35760/m.42721 type:complete len:210 (+) Transcript_35760:90-719(+)